MNELLLGVSILFIIGFIGAFLSGMLGVGGAIIKYPMLLYIPPIFTAWTFSAHQISGIVAVEVLFSSFIGLLAYRKSSYLNKKLIIHMGSAILLGSFIGSYGSNSLSENTVNIVYGVLALLAAILMFIPRKEDDTIKVNVNFNSLFASILAFIVGISSGIVGAGGGFLLVPIMLTLLKIPIRITIASSLAITFISSIGGSTGKIITGQVEYGPVVILILASVIATPLGVKIGKKLNTKILRILLAILITATALKIWLSLLF